MADVASELTWEFVILDHDLTIPILGHLDVRDIIRLRQVDSYSSNHSLVTEVMSLLACTLTSNMEQQRISSEERLAIPLLINPYRIPTKWTGLIKTIITNKIVLTGESLLIKAISTTDLDMIARFLHLWNDPRQSALALNYMLDRWKRSLSTARTWGPEQINYEIQTDNIDQALIRRVVEHELRRLNWDTRYIACLCAACAELSDECNDLNTVIPQVLFAKLGEKAKWFMFFGRYILLRHSRKTINPFSTGTLLCNCGITTRHDVFHFSNFCVVLLEGPKYESHEPDAELNKWFTSIYRNLHYLSKGWLDKSMIDSIVAAYGQ